MKASPEELKDFVIKRSFFLQNESVRSLKDLINKCGISVTDFARMMGKNRSYIHQLMRGDRRPSPQFLQEIMLISGGKIRTELDLIEPF